MAKYIPGVCNIGPAEIANRRMIGVNWLIISLAFLTIIYLLHFPPYFRFAIVLPLIISASGFYQAAFHFCSGLGMAGLYNVSKSVGKTDTVMQASFRKKDKAKAQQIFALSVITAIVIAAAVCFI